jgi:hypothetical protein
MNILAATKATDDPTKPLVARVRRSIHLRLAKLEYELLAAKDVRTNKRELVEFFLSQMPEEADDRLAEQVLAFQQVAPRRPGRRRGS